MRNWRVAGAVLMALGAVCAAPWIAVAGTIDEYPTTLHIGTPAGTACAVGCGGDANPLSGTVFSIFQNQGGSVDLEVPTLLILGIPVNTGDPNPIAPTIGSIQEFAPYTGSAAGGTPVLSFSTGGANIFGGTWNVAGFGGDWDFLDPQVYNFLGFEPPATNSSNNWGNWTGTAAGAFGTFDVTGVVPDHYALTVYRINESLGSKGLFEITWLTAPPLGSIAIAYGCSQVDATTGRCAGDGPQGNGAGNVYTTPYTEAGIWTPQTPTIPSIPSIPQIPVAAPASLALLGGGLLSLAAATAIRSLRRRTRQE